MAVRLARKQRTPASSTRRQSCSTPRHVSTRYIWDESRPRWGVSTPLGAGAGALMWRTRANNRQRYLVKVPSKFTSFFDLILTVSVVGPRSRRVSGRTATSQRWNDAQPNTRSTGRPRLVVARDAGVALCDPHPGGDQGQNCVRPPPLA